MSNFNREELKTIVYDDLGFCGCGNPEQTLIFLREILELFYDRDKKNYGDGTQDEWMCGCEKIDKKLGYENNKAMYYSYVYWLNHIDILEHGSNMPGWLSSFGTQFYESIKDLDIEEFFSYA